MTAIGCSLAGVFLGVVRR